MNDATPGSRQLWHTPSHRDLDPGLPPDYPADQVDAGNVDPPPAELIEQGRQLLVDALELAARCEEVTERHFAFDGRLAELAPRSAEPPEPAPEFISAALDTWSYRTHSYATASVLACAARRITRRVGECVVPVTAGELLDAYADQAAPPDRGYVEDATLVADAQRALALVRDVTRRSRELEARLELEAGAAPGEGAEIPEAALERSGCAPAGMVLSEIHATLEGAGGALTRAERLAVAEAGS